MHTGQRLKLVDKFRRVRVWYLHAGALCRSSRTSWSVPSLGSAPLEAKATLALWAACASAATPANCPSIRSILSMFVSTALYTNFQKGRCLTLVGTEDNGIFREQFLNGELFYSLNEARILIDQ